MYEKLRRLSACVPIFCAAMACGGKSTPAPTSQPEDTSGDEWTVPKHADPFWALTDGGRQPRGGTTRGGPIELQREPGPAWERLHEPKLAKRERDRRAIVAMAGTFVSTFEFVETERFAPASDPAQTADPAQKAPYRSWGTEVVLVLEDSPAFVSLQHILVMTFQKQDGTLSEPVVIKHWRQDWRYEDKVIWRYQGLQRWAKVEMAVPAVIGTWSQAVYQVDDSPRYETHGAWEHHKTFSQWIGHRTARPLPRRESSVRNDYNMLFGANIHTVTATGWSHTQHNLKIRVGEGGERHHLGQELGFNRYRRLKDFDTQPALKYWQASSPFWALVRDWWTTQFDTRAKLHLRPTVNDKPMYEWLFPMAEDKEAATKETVANVLRKFVKW